MLSDRVVIEISPAFPQGPGHAPPMVEVTIPLGARGPISKIAGMSNALVGNSPEIEMDSDTFRVTLPPRPLVWVTVLIRPPSNSSRGVVIVIFPAFPKPLKSPNELLNSPLG